MQHGSKLAKALASAMSDASGVAQAIDSVSNERVRSAAEAELVVQCLLLFPLPYEAESGGVLSSPLHRKRPSYAAL